MPTFRCASFIAIAAIALFLTSPSSAQEDEPTITLDIGSKAPALDIETWISNRDGAFEPVTEFQEGKVYVVEFWATWCGPCIASMPHLAELQDKHYDDGLQIISVTGEDMATVDAFLERNVRGEDELTYRKMTSAYCLTSDPDGSTERDYTSAAGMNGIPAAFIVGKSGLIEWTGMGYPLKLDEPLQQIIAGTWDREAFKVKAKKRRELEAAQRIVMQKLQMDLGKVDEKIAAGENEDALAIMDELINDDSTKLMHERLTMMRAEIALQMEGPAALAAFESGVELFKESPQALNQLAWTAVETAQQRGVVAPELMAAAFKAAQTALDMNPKDPSVLDTVSHLFQLTGDLDNAIKTQELAVENAGDLKDQLEPYLNQLKAEKAAE